MAEKRDPVAAPRNRSAALRAAYFRLIGYSQADAAKGANLGQRTLERYEACSWWSELMVEAGKQYLTELTAKSRASLLRAVQKDGGLALRVLERTVEELRPPAQRNEHTGADGGPIEVADARHRLLELLAGRREAEQ